MPHVGKSLLNTLILQPDRVITCVHMTNTTPMNTKAFSARKRVRTRFSVPDSFLNYFPECTCESEFCVSHQAGKVILVYFYLTLCNCLQHDCLRFF